MGALAVQGHTRGAMMEKKKNNISYKAMINSKPLSSFTQEKKEE
jgi:hypothetical protein